MSMQPTVSLAMRTIAKEEDLSRLGGLAQERGVRAVLAENSLSQIASLKRGDWGNLECIPVVPNVAGYIRDTVDHGLVGAGIRRVLQLGPLSLIRVGLAGLSVAPGVLRKEFPALLHVLFAMERNAFRAMKPKRYILSPQITDLAVAFDAPAAIAEFASAAKSAGVQAYVGTNNPSYLLPRLERWGVPLDGVYAPVNRSGYLCGNLAWTKSDRFTSLDLIAETISALRVTSDEEIAFAGAHGASSVVVAQDWVLRTAAASG